MLNEPRKKIILVFYDRDFPFQKWLNRPKTGFLQDFLFLNLPFIEAVPNPSQALSKSIWNFIKENNSGRKNEKIQALFEKSVKFHM